MFKAIVVAMIISATTAGAFAKDLSQKDSSRIPNPLALMRADHIMISTADYQGTVDWYHNILGFEVVREWDIEGYAEVDVGYIAANGFMIEVVGTPEAFQAEEVAPDVFTAMSDRGYVHIAFRSADVDAVAAELVSRGVELELPPTDFDAAGVRLLFIRDNNGNLIEIVTPLSSKED
ncbi:VOC family protein [Porticoccaceae bacterium]|jgi:methylmalonyl-CoA/ethylmalonyl-CoA epimerase|nr:VOC family protein [Porticoccaceae bacterium]MDB4581234.1 VOC family protein [Porticoccaceae bacterium]MDC0589326.1 VOC family protein [Porticoccaceae bacterium]MDG1080280.1 VOC family protein [Porticoccaceae bacterium]